MIRKLQVLMLAVALSGMPGCASWPPLGDPIDHVSPDAGYRLSRQPAERRSDDVFFVASFSGGGARAAALSYGVLQQLSQDVIRHDGVSKPLLDELDLLSAVSGGGVAAAAFTLEGDRFFLDFKDGFLKRNMGRELWGAILNPYNLARLASSRFARGDLLAELLDRRLYAKATYGDLLALPGRPFLVLGAADLSGGGRMEFTQTFFDVLCLDLATYPIARAVVASGAAPPTLTPITLRNAAGTCGFQAPPWLAPGVSGDPSTSRRALIAREMQLYQDRKLIPFLHLVDGAVADNLAVRTAIDAIAGLEGQADPAEFLGVGRPTRIIFLTVDANNMPGLQIAHHARAPGELTAARLAALVAIDRFSAESKLTLRRTLDSVIRQLSLRAPVELYFIEVSPEKLADAARRDELLSIPTSFSLPVATTDRVACSGREILATSAEYARLLRDLSGASPQVPDCRIAR